MFDSESGLNYNYFRDYDSSTGRYVESDPIGLRGGISTYGYVGSSPLTSIDPFGLCDNFDECAALKADIYRKSGLLMNELRKYDPVEDGQGGFPMKYGTGLTKPGGHFKEISDLQRGLKNDMTRYNKVCRNDDNNDDKWPPIPKYIDDAASRPVDPPVINQPASNYQPSNNLAPPPNIPWYLLLLLLVGSPVGA